MCSAKVYAKRQDQLVKEIETDQHAIDLYLESKQKGGANHQDLICLGETQPQEQSQKARYPEVTRLGRTSVGRVFPC